MDSIIVTVKLEREAQVRDIEVQPDINASTLAAIIAAGFGWDVGLNGEKIDYQIEATPPGRILEPDQTLAQVGAWDGSWLVLKRRTGSFQDAFSMVTEFPHQTIQPGDRHDEEKNRTQDKVEPKPSIDSHPSSESPLSSRTQGYTPKRIDEDH